MISDERIEEIEQVVNNPNYTGDLFLSHSSLCDLTKELLAERKQLVAIAEAASVFVGNADLEGPASTDSAITDMHTFGNISRALTAWKDSK